MSLNQRIQTLVDRGEYQDAFNALSGEASLPENLAATKIFLQSQIGELRMAQTHAEGLLRRHTEKQTAAICKAVIGRSILVHGGASSQGLKLVEDAREIARVHLGLVEYARYTADYVATLLHRVGIGEAAAQVQPLRNVVLTSGDARALVSTHLIQAEIAFHQGYLSRASNHLSTTEDLLVREFNLVLDGRRALVGAAIQSLDGTLSAARALAEHAERCSHLSGSVTLRIPVLGTLAHVLLLEGDFDRCEGKLREAFGMARPGGTALIALNDTTMQLLMARGSLEEAGLKADHVRPISARFDNGYSYYGLWHLHTRARWLLRIGKPHDALATAEDALPHIERVADRNLLVRMQLVTAEALGACGRPLDGATLLATALHQNPDPALDIVGEAARVAGCLAVDDPAAARDHFERAMRIFDAVGHRTARAATERLAAAAIGAEPAANRHTGVSPARAVESAAALTYLAKHPPLLGTEVLHLLRKARACSSAALLQEDQTGTRRVLTTAHDGAAPQPRAVSPYGIRIPLGSMSGRQYELGVEGCPGPAARSTLQAIERLVHASVTLTRMRQDERERTAVLADESTEGQLGIVYACPVMTDLVKTTRQAASSDVTVLITGETGSGKEVFARALHTASRRARGAFMPFNCTSFARETVEAQLFGYRRGAFTGALYDHPGIIGAADGGTLFLDEIGEMPLDVQPKLLRFLEIGEIFRLGDPHPTHVDVRVVAATNADLDGMVTDGRFREDLFYRLNVVRLKVPPLRDRREEIPLLVRALAERLAREGQREPLRFSDEAMEYLTLFSWPGNARQLANELRRVMALTDPGALVTAPHLSAEITGARLRRSQASTGPADLVLNTDQPLASAVEDVERTLIAKALERSNGNVERAAQSLGLSRKGLFLKRQRLGLL
jgi:hydrogenase-4 transcriptional activator